MIAEGPERSVSVLIPNWNGEALLKACLDAVVLQGSVVGEVILIDNGSTDASIAIAKDTLPTIRVIQAPRNEGFGRAINRGIAATAYELVLILNNDAILTADCVRELVHASDRHPTHAAFAPRITNATPPYTLYAAGLMYSNRGYGNRSSRASMEHCDDVQNVFGFCGAVALLRTRIVREVGHFNDAFLILHDDVELSVRLQLRGHRCLYVPQAVARHIGSVTVSTVFSLAVTETVKNSLCTVICCAPAYYWREHWRAVVSFHGRMWFCMLRQGYVRSIFIGLLWICLNCRWLAARRRVIQSSCVVGPDDLLPILYLGPITLNLPKGRVTLY